MTSAPTESGTGTDAGAEGSATSGSPGPSGPPHNAAEALAQRSHTPAQRIQHLLHSQPAISPALLLIVSVVVFTFLNPDFARPGTLSLLVQQTAVIAALAIGQTLIILTAGIDLSVGVIAVLSAFLMAKVSTDQGVPAVLALLLGIAVGAACGALNGFLVTRVRLPPFIVTLGTFSIFTAVLLLYSKGQSVQRSQMESAGAGLLTWTGTRFSFGEFNITTGVLVMLLMFVVVGFALSQTAWGRHVYAVGDDAEASRLAGIQVTRVLFSVYLVAGIVYGIAAWVLIGRAGAATPNLIANANLESITAVVIGGTSLFGGRGGVLGTLLGTLIVQTFTVGLSLAGVDNNYRLLAIGVLVIVAVSVDQWIRQVKA